MIDDYKYKANELGFTERRALQKDYNANVEDEINEAYNVTRTVERDLKQLVTIAEGL